jgi:hypothetical protein
LIGYTFEQQSLGGINAQIEHAAAQRRGTSLCLVAIAASAASMPRSSTPPA